MAVKIRLARAGKKKNPFYRVVAIDARKARNGQYLEKLGSYNPMADDPQTQLVLQRENLLKWLSRGALPSRAAAGLLNQQGILKEFDEAKPKRKKLKRKRKARLHSMEELKKRREKKTLAQQKTKQGVAAKTAAEAGETTAKTGEEKVASTSVTASAKAAETKTAETKAVVPERGQQPKPATVSEVEKKTALQAPAKVAPNETAKAALPPSQPEKEMKEKKN